MLKRALRFITFILLLTSSSLALALAGDGDPESEAPVAAIFGQDIFLTQLSPPNQEIEKQKAQLTREEYEAWSILRQSDRLTGMIWQALFDAYLSEHAISVTEDEIEAFNQDFDQRMEKARQEREKQRRVLIEALKSPNLTEEQRKERSEYLKTLESLRASDEEMEKNMQNEEYRKMYQEAAHGTTERWIKRWKWNQALYEQYGGKVIFQQAGLEPIDAYEQFLREHEANKSFEIFDPELKKRFYDYFQLKHFEVPPEEAKFYFEKPHWLRTEEELKQQG